MQLFQSSIQFGDNNGSEFRLKRNYNLLAGYYYNINDVIAVEPSFLVKIPTSSKAQLDINARVYYKEDYWAGLSWRTNDALILLLGLKYDRFYFAYAFDFTLTDIRRQSAGTHELTVAIKFGESARRYRWINSF